MKGLILAAAVAGAATLAFGDPSSCPMHAEHMKQASSKDSSGPGHEGHTKETSAAGEVHSSSQHDAHAKGVEERGDTAMGFSHEATTHHFRLASNGGSIEATAKDGADSDEVGRIRTHMREISGLFSEGDFAKPAFIHDREVPGTGVMKAKRKAISYVYEELSGGARVVIRTTDPDALAAVHEFLRFQISDHATGDPTEAPVR